MAYINCNLSEESKKLPDGIAITIPAVSALMPDRLANNSAGGFNESVIIDTGIDLTEYTVEGGVVSGTKITVTRYVTVKNNPSNVYIMFTAPAATVTATKHQIVGVQV